MPAAFRLEGAILESAAVALVAEALVLMAAESVAEVLELLVVFVAGLVR